MSQHQLIDEVSANLPSQRQPPSPDSTAGIVISWGAKSDILIRGTIQNRKDLLHSFVEFLGKKRQVIGGVESGILQLSGYGLSDRSVSGILERTLDHRCCPRCDKLSALDQA